MPHARAPTGSSRSSCSTIACSTGVTRPAPAPGVDLQPVYRRVYNPARQQERHDPEGKYVRRHVPELAEVPDRYLAEPWTMPADVQRAAGCEIGVDYPEPIVDHRVAREQALERYRV